MFDINLHEKIGTQVSLNLSYQLLKTLFSHNNVVIGNAIGVAASVAKAMGMSKEEFQDVCGSAYEQLITLSRKDTEEIQKSSKH